MFTLDLNDEEPQNIVINNTPIQINNVEEEENLIQYTENHFMTQINQDLTRIRTNMLLGGDASNNSFVYSIHNHSPVLSVNGSRSNSDNEEELDYYSPNRTRHNNTRRRYNKLCYEDIERALDKYYDISQDNKYSSEIDILTTYARGQKNLYIQSKHITQRKLNCLMFPSLMLSAFITIVAPFIECQHWSPGLVSGVNAVIALFISLINYLKLESSVELYLQMANQYDNLETSLELTNSKMMVLNREDDISTLVLTKIKEVEKKIIEMKLPNSILIPEEVKSIFPVICHINIFSFIKKTEVYKKNLIEKLRDVSNEIRLILYNWERESVKIMDISNSDITNIEKLHLCTFTRREGSYEQGDADCAFTRRERNGVKEKTRILYLYDIKNKIKDEIMELRTTYGFIDEVFTKEIKTAEIRKNEWTFCIPCFKKKVSMKGYLKNANPIITKYYKTMFED